MSAPAPLTEEDLTWPSDAEATVALKEFATSVRRHYGDRLKGLYLFGSRARGDHKPTSDADVAVIIADGDWVSWKERSSLVGLAYDPSLESGMLIQPWPVCASAWLNPDEKAPAFVRTAVRDAVPL